MKSFIKIIIYSFSLMLFYSCSIHQGHFIITNQSDFDIESICIKPDTKQQFINLKKGKSVNYFTSMGDKISEGSYTISFKNSSTDEIISKKFGYHSSGMQLEELINIKILNNNIVIEPKFDERITNKYKSQSKN